MDYLVKIRSVQTPLNGQFSIGANTYASAAAGAIAQNVYLFSASTGLSTVIRAWIDRTAIADALGLSHDQQVLLSQTVGYTKNDSEV